MVIDESVQKWVAVESIRDHSLSALGLTSPRSVIAGHPRGFRQSQKLRERSENSVPPPRWRAFGRGTEAAGW